MTPFIARFHRDSPPSLYLVERYRQLSTQLAIWTDLFQGSQQPAQRSPSCLVARPHGPRQWPGSTALGDLQHAIPFNRT